MEVLVSDTSVLIDLERAGLHEAVCRLGHRFVIPDLTYAEELAGREGPAWRVRGLEVIELNSEETVTAQHHFATLDTISLADAFAFALAWHRKWILLTGDRASRTLAEKHQVDCHGLLWIIELMVEAKHDAVLVVDGLKRLMAHPRCRLPRRETLALIERLMTI
jgi:predicted nucleic acid-binding protein